VKQVDGLHTGRDRLGPAPKCTSKSTPSTMSIDRNSRGSNKDLPVSISCYSGHYFIHLQIMAVDNLTYGIMTTKLNVLNYKSFDGEETASECTFWKEHI
jgi:hypothetical protein